MNQSLARAKTLFSNHQYREALREFFIFLFAVDSIGSIFMRAALWFGVAIAIMVGVDSYDRHTGEGANVKSSLGFFLLFIVLGGILTYFLFGFAPFLTT